MNASAAAFELVEHAYRAQSSDHEWLESLLEPATSAFGGRAAATASIFRVDVSEGVRLVDFAGTSEHLRAMQECLERVSPKVRSATFSAAPVVALSERLPRSNPAWEVLRRHGVEDVVAFVCRDPEPFGCNVSFLCEDAVALTPADCRRLARCSAHVAAALRLRRRSPVDEAVLDPSGRVLDARGRAKPREQRDALRRAALSLERAKLLSTREPDEALGAWRALLEGRWTLVERFDSDGRRFWIARENEPGAQKRHRLSRRERQVLGFAALGHSQKHIAYELGLATSTVSLIASSARQKLGIKTRAELIELYSAMNDGQSSS